MADPVEITLANLSGGALMERATIELRRLCENIQDPNTSPTAKRKLKIEVLLEPDDTRQMVKITSSVKTDMPGPDASKTVGVVVADPKSKRLSLCEAYTSQPLFEDDEPQPGITPFKREA